MVRPPNYDQERKERDRIKAAKKAEKLAIKVAAAKERKAAEEAQPQDDRE